MTNVCANIGLSKQEREDDDDDDEDEDEDDDGLMKRR